MHTVRIEAGGVAVEITSHPIIQRGDSPVVSSSLRDTLVQMVGAPEGCVFDPATGLMWSADDVVPKACKQAAAEKACSELRLGGFDDWRTPTIKELLSLVNYDRHSPAIDTSKFPTCKSAWYWTSTPYAPSSPDYAWIVLFDGGYANDDHRDGGGALARAVRRAAPGQ